ncbi:MAG: glycosyltransferase family 2 protein [bacterium]|nr:glycosyltransferase family 2 protein [bacterium]
MMMTQSPQIAVLIPCYNESLTVAKVIHDFRAQLPQATLYVFDNASSDDTAKIARELGVEVYYVKHAGKGNVIRQMHRFIQADIYVMVDGDDTYPAEFVHTLLAPVIHKKADMVVGSRLLDDTTSEFKMLNKWGNRFFLWILNTIFGVRLTDILSGYRAMTRELVENIPLLSTGFEIETELTIRTLQEGYIIQEVPVTLRKRPEGSYSKIRVVRDGWRILMTIMTLFRDYRPLRFFVGIASIITVIALAMGLSVFIEFLETGLVRRFPTAILSASMILLSTLLVITGLILDTINRRFREMNFQLRRFTQNHEEHARELRHPLDE